MPCSIHGCRGRIKTRSDLCTKHLLVKRRHGHPLQQPLTKWELDRLTRHVRSLLDARPNRQDVWQSLVAIHDDMKREYQGQLQVFRQALAPRDLAAQEIAETVVDVCREAGAETVVLTMVSIAYLQQFDPRRFRTDDTVAMAMALRFRKLSRANYDAFVNPVTGNRHIVAKDFRPSTQLRLGKMLCARFAAIGWRLCEQEQEEIRVRSNKVSTALKALEVAT